MSCGCGCVGVGTVTMCGVIHPNPGTPPPGVTMGGVIGTWWDDVERLKVRLAPSFEDTNASVARCTSLPPEVRAAWSGFYAAWVTYRDTPSPLISPFGSAEAFDAGELFAAQLLAWRTQIRAAGCALASPDLPPPPSAGGDALAQIPGALKFAAVAVVALAGVYAIHTIVR